MYMYDGSNLHNKKMIGYVWFKLTYMISMHPETDWNDHVIVINAGVCLRRETYEIFMINIILLYINYFFIWFAYFMIRNNCCDDLLLVYPLANRLLQYNTYSNESCWQGAQVRTLCRQNERNFAYDRLALTSLFGLCFMPVWLIKSNCYSFIYSSLVKSFSM